jgi:hypothetical protein
MSIDSKSVVFAGEIPGIVKYKVAQTVSLTGSVEFGIIIDDRVICGAKVINKRNGKVIKPFTTPSLETAEQDSDQQD